MYQWQCSPLQSAVLIISTWVAHIFTDLGQFHTSDRSFDHRFMWINCPIYQTSLLGLELSKAKQVIQIIQNRTGFIYIFIKAEI